MEKVYILTQECFEVPEEFLKASFDICGVWDTKEAAWVRAKGNAEIYLSALKTLRRDKNYSLEYEEMSSTIFVKNNEILYTIYSVREFTVQR